MADFKPPEMVVIPAGSFKMGCVSGRSCTNAERPVHEVTIASFALSKYEVTFEDYDVFTDATGRERADDRGFGRGRRPVINITWDDAVAYTKWLSEQTGKDYRLPSEAEWEYAARAGTATRYSWGNNLGHNRANCNGCGSEWDNEMSAPVGSFEANGWGLYDMHGNVWEWTQDRYNNRYVGAPNDGSAWEVGDSTARVVRGGAWYLGRLFPSLGYSRPTQDLCREHVCGVSGCSEFMMRIKAICYADCWDGTGAVPYDDIINPVL